MNIYVVLPNQLFEDTSWIEEGGRVLIVEEKRYFTDFKFHKKKLMLHRASMKYYEDLLKSKGFNVKYIEYKEDWKNLVEGKNVVMRRPYDNKLELGLSSRFKVLESPAFIGGELPKGKKPFMATYYKEQRRRLNILMEGEKPLGGRWSFDKDNRKKFPKDHIFPKLSEGKIENKYVLEAREYINNNFKENYGEDRDFIYPTTHEEARKHLTKFISERLKLFGDYEDSIGQDEEYLYHSLLSSIINIGLLTPLEIVKEVERARDVPLNSKEGFIRQVIGWREFMLKIYLEYGERERSSNYFNHIKEVPLSYYDATTGILPVDNVIKKTLKNSYAHHIERLMVMGNFMLLSEYSPNSIYRWFMEMYIDAYDWVMVPNVYGMSQFADGGIFATKPYISSSNYILKMSDFSRGDWCLTWNEMYWNFIEKHEEKFKSNHRMGLILNQLARRRVKKEMNS